MEVNDLRPQVFLVVRVDNQYWRLYTILTTLSQLINQIRIKSLGERFIYIIKQDIRIYMYICCV